MASPEYLKRPRKCRGCYVSFNKRGTIVCDKCSNDKQMIEFLGGSWISLWRPTEIMSFYIKTLTKEEFKRRKGLK